MLAMAALVGVKVTSDSFCMSESSEMSGALATVAG